jgi:hypothetical protein
LPCPADSVANYLADSVGLDDIVAAVNLCEVLALGSSTDLILRDRMLTYSVLTEYSVVMRMTITME